MTEIPPEARLAYFNKQRPGILLCHTVYSACKECTNFFKEYFINLTTADFVRALYDHGLIVKRWLDCKFYKIVNPCDKPLNI